MNRVYVIVGENKLLDNISARAAYSRREDAVAHLLNKELMWFDDRAEVVELVMDEKVPSETSGECKE